MLIVLNEILFIRTSGKKLTHMPSKINQFMNIYRQATYLRSAHTLIQLPEDHGFEVAFAGRSNAGKSSAINVITNQKGLARTSKTPGRTQQIIFFQLDDSRRLVDLPGYGYAKVPLAVKHHWQQTLAEYLQTRDCLKGLILLMDIRHPLKEYDQELLNWCKSSNMPVHVLLTKADKIGFGKGKEVLQQVQNYLAGVSSENFSGQLFSALKGQGIEEVQECLNRWLEVH